MRLVADVPPLSRTAVNPRATVVSAVPGSGTPAEETAVAAALPVPAPEPAGEKRAPRPRPTIRPAAPATGVERDGQPLSPSAVPVTPREEQPAPRGPREEPAAPPPAPLPGAVPLVAAGGGTDDTPGAAPRSTTPRPTAPAAPPPPAPAAPAAPAPALAERPPPVPLPLSPASARTAPSRLTPSRQPGPDAGSAAAEVDVEALLRDAVVPELVARGDVDRRAKPRVVVARPGRPPRPVTPPPAGSVTLSAQRPVVRRPPSRDGPEARAETHVHIDRVVVTRPAPPATRPERAASPAPGVDHAAYLARRRERS
jgi:hypothetical protein